MEEVILFHVMMVLQLCQSVVTAVVAEIVQEDIIDVCLMADVLGTAAVAVEEGQEVVGQAVGLDFKKGKT